MGFNVAMKKKFLNEKGKSEQCFNFGGRSSSDFKKAVFCLNQSQTPSLEIEPITNANI